MKTLARTDAKIQAAPPPMTAQASHCTTIAPAKWS
jgi:hypothetical protein